MAGFLAGDPVLSSIYSDEYRRVLALLVQARKKAGMTQQELAAALQKPQSFVSKYERGERRLDIIEFVKISRLVGADPHVLLSEANAKS